MKAERMESNRARLAVFISGGGTGLQSIIDASKCGVLSARVVWVVSSSRKAYGLERAAKEKIESFVFVPPEYDSPERAAEALLQGLSEREVEYIALAGYLKLLPDVVVRTFAGRILNIHPGPLPKYGGKGMYGHFVHEAVLRAGEKESGPTVHLVDEIYDHGRILEHVKVAVRPDDTPDTLAARVLVEEHKLYPRVIEKLIKGHYEREK